MQPTTIIVGTAGHVDHGKTALIRALTGVETDRLPEEKARGISIDIGFASFTLPSGRRVGIVDVPGHERFIKNMLAGASGIDLVLLVVAADEGIMPQTREHFDILRLLGIKKGIVVTTKRDLVDDEWLGLVREEIADFVKGTFLAGAPVVPVSAVTRQGLDELEATIDRVAAETEAKDASAPARLPIDRIFSVAGFGTVITGTLVAGRIATESRLELLPADVDVRVRQIQVHGRTVPEARAGQRVALNLAGIDREVIQRGDVLAAPGTLAPTNIFGAKLHVLPDALRPVADGARVHLHVGTAEVLARVFCLDRDALGPGDEALIRIKTEQSVVVGRGDRYIIRSYSPMLTIGGGEVIEPHLGEHVRRRRDALADLAAKAEGTPADLLVAAARKRGLAPSTAKDLARDASLTPEAARPELDRLVASGDLVALEPGGLYAARQSIAAALEQVEAALADYHRRYPLRRGMPREELRTRALKGVDGRVYPGLLNELVRQGAIVAEQERVSAVGHAVRLTPEQERAKSEIEARFRSGAYAPPDLATALAGVPGSDAVKSELMLLLGEEGSVIRLSDDVYIHRETLADARARVRATLRETGKITVAAFRDMVGTSRKFALPLLERFDAEGLTRRAGDERVPGPAYAAEAREGREPDGPRT
ncbi:MAG: selenocysteine-specific translation elongation factor [Chloroflexota bacterium]